MNDQLKQNILNLFHDEWLRPKPDGSRINMVYRLFCGVVPDYQLLEMELKGMVSAHESLAELNLDYSHIIQFYPKMKERIATSKRVAIGWDSIDTSTEETA
mgnify:CR=1 FL=1